MKSLSKLCLLVVLLTTQQNILSTIKYSIYTNDHGPLIQRKNISGGSAQDQLNAKGRMEQILLERYGNRIKIEAKSPENELVDSKAETLSVQARWTSYSEMPRLNKLLALVVNLATRALEKC